jgi:tRNA A58 N-methylase Trm61
MIAVFYYASVILLLVILMCLAFYSWSLLISAVIGTPFVRVPQKLRNIIFERAKFKKGSHVVEIGSGNGDLAFYLASEYDVKVTGVELNPHLYLLSQFKKRILPLKNSQNVQFKLKNALNYDYVGATHIYLYMLPPLIRKLTPQIKKTASKGTIVISYTFCIPRFKKYLIEKIDTKPYPVYYYKL